jgi:hypothetical protein
MIEYKLVPIEPTEEMLKAGFRAWNACDLPKGSNSFLDWKDAYEAMLEAAPTPESITIPLAEYEAMKKDAERYRWMRNYTGATYDGFYNIPLNNLRLPKRWMYGSIARHWDEAIDKAMEI